MTQRDLYNDILSMRKGTKKYYKAVSKYLGITPNVNVLQMISIYRKTKYEGYKKGHTLTEVWQRAVNDTKYLNELKLRDKKIMSGEYFEYMTNKYVQSYLSKLEEYGYDEKILDYLKNNPAIILEGLLPPLKDLYPKTIKRGEIFHASKPEYEDFVNQVETSIKTRIKEFYGDTI